MYAKVVATLALLVAFTGTAYAALITGADVKDESLTGRDVKDGSLHRSDLAAGVIPGIRHVLQRDITDLHDDGSVRIIASLGSLPPGNYLLTADTVASDFTDDGFVRCAIFVGGQNMNGTLGSAVRIGPVAGASTVSQISISAVAKRAHKFNVTLRCWQTNGAAASRVEESHLIAIRTGRLRLLGDPQF